MLTKAREEAPGCQFVLSDLATWVPDTAPDLIFSNAALHWVTGHETLFPRLASLLKPGGVLAIQIPAMHDAAFRALQNEVAAHGPWASHLRDASYARGILTAAVGRTQSSASSRDSYPTHSRIRSSVVAATVSQASVVAIMG